nr:histone acetyltransferase MYST2 [Hymenolepis microstoma]
MSRKRRRGVFRSTELGGREIVRKAQLYARKNALTLPKFDFERPPLVVPKYCVVNGCDSHGHVDGIRKNHITLSGCPRFHNQESSFYQQLASKNIQINGDRFDAADNITTGRQYVKETEPYYDDLGTAEDLDLFRRAQQKLVSDKSKEVHEHIMILSNLKSDSHVDTSLSDSNVPLDPPLFTENNVKEIVIGDWEMNTVYASAFPPNIACLPRIYICEFCLSHMPFLVGYRRHRLRCRRRFPPGNEIYRKDKFSFFEIDGFLEKEYCHNLCLVAKLYLKQKTVHEIERVPAFLFYVLTVADEAGCHIIGYFSKHKPEEQTLPNVKPYNNLSCVLVLPQYQRQGFGHMLIDFSYLLSRVENRLGTPERPLSDQGLLVYRRYWKYILLSFMLSHQGRSVSLDDISDATGIVTKDIIQTLLDMGMFKYLKSKYYIVKDREKIEQILSQIGQPKPDRLIDPQCLCWITAAAPNSKDSTDFEQPSPTIAGSP